MFLFWSRSVFVVFERPVLPCTFITPLRRSVEQLPNKVQTIGTAVVASVGVVDDAAFEREGAEGHQLRVLDDVESCPFRRSEVWCGGNGLGIGGAGRPTPHTQHKTPTAQRSSHDPLTLHPAL